MNDIKKKTLHLRNLETDRFQSTSINSCLHAWFLDVEKARSMQTHDSFFCIFKPDGGLMSRHELQRVVHLIYLLEDDESIRKLVLYALETQGFQAEGFDVSDKFWEAMQQQAPELVLLDIMLPGEDGLSVLRRIRGSGSRVPVIMLTARTTEYDRVEGLDAGADDYVSKPFGIMELMARIRAVLRRSGQTPSITEFQYRELLIFWEKHEVYVEGDEVSLTNKEFELLRLLVENRGIVLTREILLENIWGLGTERENRTLDVHIRTLRSKLGPAGSYIQTVRGVGYKFTGDSI